MHDVHLDADDPIVTVDPGTLCAQRWGVLATRCVWCGAAAGDRCRNLRREGRRAHRWRRRSFFRRMRTETFYVRVRVRDELIGVHPGDVYVAVDDLAARPDKLTLVNRVPDGYPQ